MNIDGKYDLIHKKIYIYLYNSESPNVNTHYLLRVRVDFYLSFLFIVAIFMVPIDWVPNTQKQPTTDHGRIRISMCWFTLLLSQVFSICFT